PRPDETAENAAHRRLKEEMGLESPLSFAFSFQYRAAFDNGLIEHELDHVFIGHSGQRPRPNPAEVADYRWLDLPAIEEDVSVHPDKYTPWFKLIYQRISEWR